MSTVVYQCPCCGAPLAYGAESGKLECASCSNQYDLSAIEVLSGSSEERSIRFDMPKASFDMQEDEHMQAYICKSCGAELMTEDTTTATECPYCGSPTILPDRIEGGVKPEKVIPFTVTKEQAQRLFEEYFKGKRLLPNVFLDTRNRIAEMRRVYVPYWLFGCRAGGSMLYNAQKKRVFRQGEWEITETDHFVLSRSGLMDFSEIPVDGSVKLDNKITESLEPYDMRAAVDFEPGVLAGALADHADVDSADCEERARQRVENSMEQALRNTVGGYINVTTRRRDFFTEGCKVTPVLMPVWLITTEKNGTTYTFAINGQTGKLTCDVPADTKKSLLWGFGVFAGVLAALFALMYLGGMLDDMMMIVSVIAAMIAGFGTVAVLTGQLKQAVSAQSAGDYIVQGSFALTQRQDYFLHTTRTRRQIAQRNPGPPSGPMPGGYHGAHQGMHPMQRPGVHPGQRMNVHPRMQQGVRPGMHPGTRPGVHPGTRPGMRPGAPRGPRHPGRKV